MVQTYTVDETHIVPHGKLLEGITYDERNNNLYYIDIPAGSVFVLNGTNNKQTETPLSIPKSYIVSKSVGVIGLTSDPNKLICGVQEGISILDLNSGNVKSIVEFPNNGLVNGIQYRSNDGSVGPDGSFWVGTMDDNETTKFGSMWYLKDKNSKLIDLWDNAGIPNGLNWDLSRKIVYWTDSIDETIYKFNYDPINNKIDLNSKEPWFINNGTPDGSCIDKDGNLYIALWGSYKIVRFTPDKKIDMEWKFPSKNITCCTFGGENFSTLYVTTADLGEDDEIDNNDIGAAVFRIDVSDLGIQGVPKNKFIV
ncbi:hypothetical protein C6P40_003375 [Pichia californica]|uniref:SMP-30/Gluconolactonase/LRE-like region domain-containing protein n=1 Tax=Pichia californica TaxID=460514 RepID=A0A9P6WNC3_9ASCO|nr:hypothetical protein C6P42_004439 [[Candida] californica]KAG0690261.1 hypothetical protein C6P40_003375 [[Candida] californica]